MALMEKAEINTELESFSSYVKESRERQSSMDEEIYRKKLEELWTVSAEKLDQARKYYVESCERNVGNGDGREELWKVAADSFIQAP